MDKNWLEKAIRKKYINFHKYEDFEKIETIGTGASGKVSRAEWVNRDMFVAIKSIKMFANADKDTWGNFIKEVIIISNLISFSLIMFKVLFLNVVEKSSKS